MKMCKTRALSFVAGSLIVLAGCGKKEKNDETSPTAQPAMSADVLVNIDGKPALTLSEFQKFVKDATQADQQMQFMMQIMPDFEEQLFERAKLRELFLAGLAKRDNFSAHEEYKKLKEQAEKQLETLLNQQVFIKLYVGQINDDEIKKYYDENKDKDQNLLENQAGVEAKAVSFKNEKDAHDFLKTVQAHKNDLEAAGKLLKKTVDNLGLVSAMSMIDAKVKEAILALKSLPTVIVIKGGDSKVWVVKALKREQAKYRPFERVKDTIKEMLTGRKIEETFEKKLAEYQKEHMQINRAYFEQKRKDREEKQKQAAEIAKKGQPAGKELNTKASA